MNDRKKIAVILSRFPFPLDKGDKLRVYHQIVYLSKFHDIYLFALNDKKVVKQHLDELYQYCKEIRIFPQRLFDIVWQSCKSFLSGEPVQVGYFFSSTIDREIRKVLIELQPHTVYCQLSRTAKYGKNLPFHTVIDYQDAFSMNYARIQNNYSGIKRWFYKREASAMKKFEINMAIWFDAQTIISQFDKAQISIEPNNIVVVENGVNTNYFTSKDIAKQFDILFLGNLGYLPNRNAVEFLVEKIVPLLIEKFPDIKVAIAGAGGETMMQYNTENLLVFAWMDDIRVMYDQAKIFVAPLFIGAGLQNKLLEAMSMGLPCVTTNVANASLCATPNEHLLVAASPVEFVQKIIALLQDEVLYKELAAKGRFFVESRYSWDNANEKLNNLM